VTYISGIRTLAAVLIILLQRSLIQLITKLPFKETRTFSQYNENRVRHALLRQLDVSSLSDEYHAFVRAFNNLL